MKSITIAALALLLASVAPAFAADEKTPVPAEKRVIELGGTIESVRTGGAGRYLIVHLKDADKLIVVDVVAGKTLKPIPAPGDFQFAASREKLLLALNGQRVIQRWDLATQTREKTALLTDDRPVKLVSMGDAGDGPLALWCGGKVDFIDVATLKPLKVSGTVVDQGASVSLWPSADGRTFAAYGWTSGQIQLMRLGRVKGAGVTCVTTASNAWVTYNAAWGFPNPDGSLLIRNDGETGVLAEGMTPLDTTQFKGAILYPTEDVRFLLALRRTNPYAAAGNIVSIVSAADRQVLFTVREMEPVTGGGIGTVIGRLGNESRVRYLPGQKLIVCIPDSDDRIVIHPFDLPGSLQGTGADYLFVISVPPGRVPADSTLEYQVQTLASAKKLKYALSDGPKGMTLSNDGKLQWKAAMPEDRGKAHALITVADDSGQEAVQRLDLQVTPASDEVASTAQPELPAAEKSLPPQPAPTDAAAPAPSTKKPASPDSQAKKPATPAARAIARGIALAGENPFVTTGFGGKSMLVLEGDHLRRLGPDGSTVIQTMTLPHACEWIGERKDYFVALSNETKSLDILDSKTLKVRRSVQMDYMRRNDLALNPTKPVSYVAIDKPAGGGEEGFSHQILEVSESTGEVREPEDFVGTFLRAAPDGSRLYCGYKDIFKNGEELLINPNNVNVIPKYGNIDVLMIYDISGRSPRLVAQKKDAGANGQGIAVSADGKRVSYLSYVGYPLYSNNIAAWDPADLTRRPVSYGTKDHHADCRRLSFHPVLPIAASPAQGGAACFNRESGDPEPDRLDLHEVAADLKVINAWFSPDGTAMLLDCQGTDQFYLLPVKLKLTAAELEQLKSPPPPPIQAAPPPAVPREPDRRA
ncbi:MAG: hypothetical protein JWP03_410 [Phycisphaerales bacterium]|nr:hypothetical protein [Phycisphaerales bacterium]